MGILQHTFALPESRTHRIRTFTLLPVSTELVDAYLTIEQGEVGPRGGTSKHNVESYFVQELWELPESAHMGRTFLLVKDRPVPRDPEFVFDPEDDSADPYCVYVRRDRIWSGWCTCKGFECTKDCKHRQALSHAVGVLGWGM